MRRMIPFAIAIFLGLAVSAWILRREIRRAPMQPTAEQREMRKVDDWQRSIQLDQSGGYQSKSERDREPMERLRREERRQRPEEGRN